MYTRLEKVPRSTWWWERLRVKPPPVVGHIGLYNVAGYFDDFYENYIEVGGVDDFIPEYQLLTSIRANLPPGIIDPNHVIGNGGKYTMLGNHNELIWKDGGIYGIKWKTGASSMFSAYARPP